MILNLMASIVHISTENCSGSIIIINYQSSFCITVLSRSPCTWRAHIKFKKYNVRIRIYAPIGLTFKKYSRVSGPRCQTMYGCRKSLFICESQATPWDDHMGSSAQASEMAGQRVMWFLNESLFMPMFVWPQSDAYMFIILDYLSIEF